LRLRGSLGRRAASPGRDTSAPDRRSAKCVTPFSSVHSKSEAEMERQMHNSRRNERDRREASHGRVPPLLGHSCSTTFVELRIYRDKVSRSIFLSAPVHSPKEIDASPAACPDGQTEEPRHASESDGPVSAGTGHGVRVSARSSPDVPQPAGIEAHDASRRRSQRA
jgi:hypothetical protein